MGLQSKGRKPTSALAFLDLEPTMTSALPAPFSQIVMMNPFKTGKTFQRKSDLRFAVKNRGASWVFAGSLHGRKRMWAYRCFSPKGFAKPFSIFR